MTENYIITDFDVHLPIRCSMQRFDHIQQQMHDFFEISMIVSGNCNLKMEEHLYSLKEDDVFCVTPLTLHELHGVNCVIVTVLFKQNVFEQILPFPMHPRFFCNSSVSDQQDAFSMLRTLIARIVKNNVDKLEGYELRDWSYIYNIMDVLYRNFRLKQSSTKEAKNYKYAMRMSEISFLIQERYTENITLNELANEIHLSVPYLSKFFTEHYGMNFLSYLNQFRLMHAVSELTETDKNIDDIAADSGFPNSHAFVTIFKKQYGMLPKDYRRMQKLEKENAAKNLEQHNYIAGLKKYLIHDPDSKMVAPEKTITIDFPVSETTYRLSHTWKKTMTVGRASDVLITDVQEMIHEIQVLIGFEFLKLDGIFSDELHVYNESASGKPIYSFTYIDKILDFLISNNLKPWIQLSYMPEKLAKYPNKRLFGANVSQPQSIHAWCELVTQFLQHITARYGTEVVERWQFGVWNQPNSGSDLFGFTDEKEFFKFYKATFNCVKNFHPVFRFCLPPTYYIVDTDYENWYLHFIEWCRSNGCLPDSLSFTYYDTRPFTPKNHSKESFGFVYSMSLSENPDGLKDFIMQVLRERRKLGLNGMPVYLLEWNNTPSQQDLLNDTCFKSCYIVKNILENYDRLDSFTYQALTDLMADGPLPDKLFFGGLGLFTVNKIPKASFYAFFLLNKLGNQFLGRGEGYFITKENNRYQIMLYNYQHFTYLYANGERFDMTETDRYTVFADVAPLHMELNLLNIASGSYKISEYYVNRSQGSVYDQWIAMGALEPNSAEELELLKKTSHPGFHQHLVTVGSDEILRLNVTLDLLEIRLIEVLPITDTIYP